MKKPEQTPQPRGSSTHRFWAIFQILQVRLRFIVLMVVVGLIAGNWEDIMNHWDRWRRPAAVASEQQTQEVEYFCPMHPNIIRPEPGNCPICGMPLSQRQKSAGSGQLPAGVLARVQLTPQKVQMGRIGTSPVEFRLLSTEVRSVGIVDFDETRRAFISARIKGRLDKLMVNFIGQRVEKGQPLASIYSPDLLIGQQELLLAARDLEQQKGKPGQESSQALLDSARQKLTLWGVTAEQIEDILKQGKPQTHLILFSPITGIVIDKKALEGRYVIEGDDLYTIADLSQVWLQAKIFEDQIQGIHEGTAVEVTSTAYPDEIFAGRIGFVSYSVDPATRTVSARVEVPNPEAKLKPGMYVRMVIRNPVGQVTEPDAAPAESVAQTKAATIDTDILVQAYLALMADYAGDKADAAKVDALIQAAESLAKAVEPSQAAGWNALAEQVRQLRGKDLAEQRKVLPDLSRQLIAQVRLYPPQTPVFVAHCPMVKADWLTSTQQIANPYYGSSMLTCGEITGEIKAGSAAISEAEQYVIGYYCPIYPDRLFDQPQHCPIDKFPIKRMRVQKTLAVPESAVVDTGRRKVVYRESESGTFDMVEITTGPRAGEYFPVLTGLKAGDRVATRGAFLVDAENRLNPAAASQYFGSSGGPKDTASGETSKP